MASRGPIVEKMVIKSIRKLTRIRNNGIIQFQFFHRCNVDTTGSIHGILSSFFHWPNRRGHKKIPHYFLKRVGNISMVVNTSFMP